MTQLVVAWTMEGPAGAGLEQRPHTFLVQEAMSTQPVDSAQPRVGHAGRPNVAVPVHDV